MASPETPPDPSDGELTGLLHAWRQGEAAALERLMPLVYDELRRLASARLRGSGGGHTLQPTVLVHEAFLRLVREPLDWQDRAHFFGVACRAMRNVAVDHWRAQAAQKRGGDGTRVDLTAGVASVEPRSVDVMALDAALSRLERMSPQQARIVELRFFGGLGMEEIAEVLACSRSTVFRDLRAAQAWLFRELSAPG
jgi:RNA polymerase sigma factor (TIGR02999 family)